MDFSYTGANTTTSSVYLTVSRVDDHGRIILDESRVDRDTLFSDIVDIQCVGLLHPAAYGVSQLETLVRADGTALRARMRQTSANEYMTQDTLQYAENVHAETSGNLMNEWYVLRNENLLVYDRKPTTPEDDHHVRYALPAYGTGVRIDVARLARARLTPAAQNAWIVAWARYHNAYCHALAFCANYHEHIAEKDQALFAKKSMRTPHTYNSVQTKLDAHIRRIQTAAEALTALAPLTSTRQARRQFGRVAFETPVRGARVLWPMMRALAERVAVETRIIDFNTVQYVDAAQDVQYHTYNTLEEYIRHASYTRAVFAPSTVAYMATKNGRVARDVAVDRLRVLHKADARGRVIDITNDFSQTDSFSQHAAAREKAIDNMNKQNLVKNALTTKSKRYSHLGERDALATLLQDIKTQYDVDQSPVRDAATQFGVSKFPFSSSSFFNVKMQNAHALSVYMDTYIRQNNAERPVLQRVAAAVRAETDAGRVPDAAFYRTLFDSYTGSASQSQSRAYGWTQPTQSTVGHMYESPRRHINTKQRQPWWDLKFNNIDPSRASPVAGLRASPVAGLRDSSAESNSSIFSRPLPAFESSTRHVSPPGIARKPAKNTSRSYTDFDMRPATVSHRTGLRSSSAEPNRPFFSRPLPAFESSTRHVSPPGIARKSANNTSRSYTDVDMRPATVSYHTTTHTNTNGTTTVCVKMPTPKCKHMRNNKSASPAFEDNSPSRLPKFADIRKPVSPKFADIRKTVSPKFADIRKPVSYVADDNTRENNIESLPKSCKSIKTQHACDFSLLGCVWDKTKKECTKKQTKATKAKRK